MKYLKSLVLLALFTTLFQSNFLFAANDTPHFSSSWVHDPNTNFYGWHGQSAAEYQTTFSQMNSNGYRLISIDVNVSNNSPTYASAWAYDPNKGFYGWHGQTATEYQTTFNQMVSQGFRLISIDTHTIHNIIYYASAWVHDPSTSFYGWHGQTEAEYQATFNQMTSQGYRLISIDAHVFNNNVYYASAWVHDPGTSFYGWHGQTAAQYQTTFNQMTSQGFRLLSINTYTLNNTVYYSTAWVHAPNTSFYGWHGQTEAEYQTTFNQMASQGYRLIDIDTHTEQTQDADWNVMGQDVPGLAVFDETIKNFMLERNISQGALALAYEGRLILSKGFSLGLSTEPTSPQSLFRIASLSKPITSTAIMKLVENGSISLEDKMADLLSMNQFSDARMGQITVKQLLQHTGGWDRNSTFDPMFRDHQISDELQIAMPINKSHIIDYMKSRYLQNAPGQAYGYSNYGYMLLGKIIEAVSGKTYEEFVNDKILTPLCINDMKPGHSLLNERLNDEVKYHSQYNNTTVMDSTGNNVESPYGSFNLENMDSHGGWVASVVEFARFTSLFDFPANNPVLTQNSIDAVFALPEYLNGDYTSGDHYYGMGWEIRDFGGGNRNTWHTGSLPGTYTLAVRRSDGLSWVVFLNQRDDTSGLDYSVIDTKLHEAANTITNWPAHDMFDKCTYNPSKNIMMPIMMLLLDE